MALPLAHFSCADSREPLPAPTAAAASITFVEVAEVSGIDFVHQNGETGQLYFPETMHGGAAFVDVDNDGYLDVYLVQGGPLPVDPGSIARNRLYRNRGADSFEDITELSGTGDTGYGTGIAVADYDRDGWHDLYVTNLGTNRLFRNLGLDENGDVSFVETSEKAGVGGSEYSTSAAFFDYDADGDLDLWVCNYVDWTAASDPPCIEANGIEGYCSPLQFAPVADRLYRNEGRDRDGNTVFTDVSTAAGLTAQPATGLGLAIADFDGDGRLDVYVANDQMPNQLWIYQGDGRFENEALLRGCALNESGRVEAGMGTATADVDGDGDWDLFVVHLSGETNTFYRNEGSYFRDATDELRLGLVSLPFTGFGTAILDFDNDGIDDIFIANGKVNAGESLELDFREPNQLLQGNADGTFNDISSQCGLGRAEVSRAAAFGDYDNDGDIDILIANNGGRARLLRNELDSRHHWLTIAVNGAPEYDRDVIGTKVVLTTGGISRTFQVQPAFSYTASNDPRIHVGLGSAASVAEINILFPDGTSQHMTDVASNQILHVRPTTARVPPSR